MYVCGLVIPVSEGSMDAYRRWAENGVKFFKEYGCLEIVECWEDFIPHGEQTDFRKAVAAREGARVVFTWQIWTDKESFQNAEERMHGDPRMDSAGDPPFDARRLILRCFQPLATMGRK